MKKICYAIMMLVLLWGISCCPVTVSGEETSESQKAEITIEYSDDKEYFEGIFYPDSECNLYIPMHINTPYAEGKTEMKIECSDTDVLGIPDKIIELCENSSYAGFRYIICDVKGIGTATVTFSIGDVKQTADVVILPGQYAEITKMSQPGYNQLKVQWKTVNGCSGYLLQRASENKDDFKTIKTVSGVKKTTVTVTGKWEKTYRYRVIPYVTYNKQKLYNESCYYNAKEFMLERPKAKLVSVSQKGSSSLTVKWEKIDGAQKYKLYRSERENGKYECIYTTGSKNSYTQKVTKGKQYFYYVKAEFEEGAGEKSNTLTGLVTQEGKAASYKQTDVKQIYSNGKYTGYRATSDRTYYYELKNTLYMVCVQTDGNLKIYTVDTKSKCKFYRNVKLEKYEIWGGFYQGPDDNFYVAVGYRNPKESDKKVVIKVFQYDSKWKLKKTCKIKGSATNVFEGIYEPFRASGCSMTMQGTTLYLATGRTMYVHSDGLHHQSNIGFKINTKKMTYECDSPYTSHSFQQIAKFKDGDLYQIDHGDAYPRALVLTITSRYGTDKESETEKKVFSIKGSIGENFTGVKVGGMEVGENNVMICGTAQPHGYKVKDVTGYGNNLKYNAFVITANRKTGKSKVIWLTKYNPKTTNVEVGETRMVKLTDNRFAVLYSTRKNDKDTLHYVVVDNEGKKICEKTYQNIWFTANSDPVLYKGYIRWVASGYDRSSYQYLPSRYYKIPVVY